MNQFSPALRQVLDSDPFNGSQRLLAEHVGIDRGLLSRVLNEERDPTPEFVGRLCAALQAEPCARLLNAFLNDVVAATAALASKSKAPRGKSALLNKVSVKIECEPQQKVG